MGRSRRLRRKKGNGGWRWLCGVQWVVLLTLLTWTWWNRQRARNQPLSKAVRKVIDWEPRGPEEDAWPRSRRLQYLRVPVAQLDLDGDRTSAEVVAPACPAGERNGCAPADFENQTYEVQSSFRAAIVAVRFVTTTHLHHSLTRCESRTTVHVPLTHFALKNLAHWTFDLAYPVYATVAQLQQEHGDLSTPIRLLLDATPLRNAHTGQLEYPRGGEALVQRLRDLLRPLVSDIRDVTEPGPVGCYADLVLGAREQQLRRSNWDQAAVMQRVTDGRARQFHGFRALLQRYYEEYCPRETHQTGNHTVVVLGRSSPRRRLRNALQVARSLPEATFHDRFGDLPWCRQYHTVHAARVLIAMHGAEWAHLFSVAHPAELMAVEIFPPCARPLSFFGAVARHLGVARYHRFRVRDMQSMRYDRRYSLQRRCEEVAVKGVLSGTLRERCCLEASVEMERGDMRELRKMVERASVLRKHHQ
ncbi:hypothetical protein CDCA_CDCA10G2972 [Cyanidium caldarium]|uniref:Uncharacterized protein n=1 Tax=Cyanidium caldarium TaxID=2771 RepID=A0AAV9IXE7_CYACA|nr:hypothetical protein CDCA_CDCA10G2972 [Cyanidium caldarium]